ncbi:MAG: pyridoxamine 5'-phosphate oxidase family protein [Nitrososphaera sp.]|uniref:pyridoxamine 5'-phosphate oxidase family protein n=1 Tax=Nitrososphaera sp. TaxID=1971748 RepID=UPI00182B1A99|nr:pyridoxamine 5'-phosphate oxidase family protein [Nitrososphaera sp.]NWG36768.1 pyridoxamine 5'-phosphate oxidase family protein [Nitrososphaera sp.]
MQLVRKFEIKSREKMIEFLNSQPAGRLASIDEKGYPQVIPMNFVWADGAVYMHSHPAGEKIENMLRNPHVGFEVDRDVCFLPSYYFHPTDASQADTLYISVVIKGRAELVRDAGEKARALNALMEKYQKEGGYEPLAPEMPVVREVAVIKVIPDDMRGKYKIGQHWSRPYRLKVAQSIVQREGLENARPILAVMQVIIKDGRLEIESDPEM